MKLFPAASPAAAIAANRGITVVCLLYLCSFYRECWAARTTGLNQLEATQEALRTNFVDDAIMVDEGIALPRFMAEVKNQTVTAGRAARLTCKVKDLGNYKVAWVRVDTQTILTIHHNIITRNQRISLSHHDHKIWRLHINNIQESDRGWYMCQVNTDPMRSERGFLEVVVPPSIIDARTSTDIVVKEGSPVNLTCDARGSPRPKIMWKREDGDLIRYNEGSVSTVDGNSLVFAAASRAHVGEYLCIASNGVPPSISKRIVLRVQFAPMIWVQNQLEYAIVGRNVSLRCNTESYPPAIHYWRLGNQTAISSGQKYKVHKEMKKFVTQVTLNILNVDQRDFGTYECVAKNPLGESDGTINLSERIIASPSWNSATKRDFAPTEETSFGEFQPPSLHNLDQENDQKHAKNAQRRNQEPNQRTDNQRHIFNGDDLSYQPYPPTSTENTWDKEKGRYPLFGNGAPTTHVIISKWTFTAITFLTTKMFLSQLLQVSFFAQ